MRVLTLYVQHRLEDGFDVAKELAQEGTGGLQRSWEQTRQAIVNFPSGSWAQEVEALAVMLAPQMAGADSDAPGSAASGVGSVAQHSDGGGLVGDMDDSGASFVFEDEVATQTSDEAAAPLLRVTAGLLRQFNAVFTVCARSWLAPIPPTALECCLDPLTTVDLGVIIGHVVKHVFTTSHGGAYATHRATDTPALLSTVKSALVSVLFGLVMQHYVPERATSLQQLPSAAAAASRKHTPTSPAKSTPPARAADTATAASHDGTRVQDASSAQE